jgi:hypothetical protein
VVAPIPDQAKVLTSRKRPVRYAREKITEMIDPLTGITEACRIAVAGRYRPDRRFRGPGEIFSTIKKAA